MRTCWNHPVLILQWLSGYTLTAPDDAAMEPKTLADHAREIRQFLKLATRVASGTRNEWSEFGSKSFQSGKSVRPRPQTDEQTYISGDFIR